MAVSLMKPWRINSILRVSSSSSSSLCRITSQYTDISNRLIVSCRHASSSSDELQMLINKNLEQRRNIKRELFRGGFVIESTTALKGKAKTLHGMPFASTPESSPIFPAINLCRIATNEKVSFPQISNGCVSLVVVGGRGPCAKSMDTYFKRFKEEIGTQPGDDKIKMFEIVSLDQLLFYPFQGYVRHTLRKCLDVERQNTTLQYFGWNKKAIHNILPCINRFTAQAYIVDKEGRIRWHAIENPSERELEYLFGILRDLASGNNGSVSLAMLDRRRGGDRVRKKSLQ